MGARLLKSSISFVITWPTELKIYRMILDIDAHSRSVPDFAISAQGALWGRASCNLQIDSQPTVLMRSSWNLVGWYLSSYHTLLRSRIFYFLPRGAVGARLGVIIQFSLAAWSHVSSTSFCLHIFHPCFLLEIRLLILFSRYSFQISRQSGVLQRRARRTRLPAIHSGRFPRQCKSKLRAKS